MGRIFGFLNHGEQDLQLLRLKGQDLLRVLVDRGRLHVLRQLPKIRREFEALDATPVEKNRGVTFLTIMNVFFRSYLMFLFISRPSYLTSSNA